MNQIFLQTGGAGGTGNLLFLVLIIVVFVFFIIIPNFRKQRELKKFRNELKKGDKILTTGGIYGKVVEIKDFFVIIEVEDKSRFKVDKSAIGKDMSGVNQARKR